MERIYAGVKADITSQMILANATQSYRDHCLSFHNTAHSSARMSVFLTLR